jgi:hypothetical protein
MASMKSAGSLSLQQLEQAAVRRRSLVGALRTLMGETKASIEELTAALIDLRTGEKGIVLPPLAPPPPRARVDKRRKTRRKASTDKPAPPDGYRKGLVRLLREHGPMGARSVAEQLYGATSQVAIKRVRNMFATLRREGYVDVVAVGIWKAVEGAPASVPSAAPPSASDPAEDAGRALLIDPKHGFEP